MTRKDKTPKIPKPYHKQVDVKYAIALRIEGDWKKELPGDPGYYNIRPQWSLTDAVQSWMRDRPLLASRIRQLKCTASRSTMTLYGSETHPPYSVYGTDDSDDWQALADMDFVDKEWQITAVGSK